MFSLRTWALCRAQEWVCAYCPAKLGEGEGQEDPTFDHVIPKSRKGIDALVNGLACCRDCNNAKGNRMPNARELEILARIYPLACIELTEIRKRLREAEVPEVLLTATGGRKNKATVSAKKRLEYFQEQDMKFGTIKDRGWDKVGMTGEDMRLPRAYRPASLPYVQAEAAALGAPDAPVGLSGTYRPADPAYVRTEAAALAQARPQKLRLPLDQDA